MYIRNTLAIALVIVSAASTSAATGPVSSFPLSEVMSETQEVLDQYQTNKSANLPDLVSADFDFKTVVQTTMGGGINLIIFTIGAAHQNSVTSDVEFLYKPHAEALPTHQSNGEISVLLDLNSKPKAKYNDALMNTLIAAGKAAASKPPAPASGSRDRQLDFCTVSTTIAFGVVDDGKGGASGPIATLVTASLNVEANKNSTQTVKLTFSEKSNSCK